jgi:hypothetical protein
MNVELAGLPVGKWRYLTLPEIDKLNQMVSESSKTDVAPKTRVQYIPKRKKSDEGGGMDADYMDMPSDRPRGKSRDRNVAAAADGARAEKPKSDRPKSTRQKPGADDKPRAGAKPKGSKPAAGKPRSAKPERVGKIIGEKSKARNVGKFKDFRGRK